MSYNKDLCVIVIGMSGTGKTTFVSVPSSPIRNSHS